MMYSVRAVLNRNICANYVRELSSERKKLFLNTIIPVSTFNADDILTAHHILETQQTSIHPIEFNLDSDDLL